MSEWSFEHNVTCIVCPECAFTFDAHHEDVEGGYSCPLCSGMRAEAERDALRDALADVLRGGEHDGPCQTIEGEDFYDPYEPCAIHVRVSAERYDRARALLPQGEED